MVGNPLAQDGDRVSWAGWVRFGTIPVVVLAAVASPRPTSGATAHPSVTATPPAGPRLSISITDGQHTARLGEQLSYLIRVQDSGPDRVPDLTVTQTMPSGMRLVSASPGDRVSAGRITWHVRLAGHSAARMRSTLRLQRIPGREQRLAAVACAAAPHGRPLICAAHLDLLPGGLAAASPAGAAAQSRQPGSRETLLGGAAAALAALAAASVLVFGGRRFWRRRRLRQTD